MGINCTNFCIYQHDGLCNLKNQNVKKKLVDTKQYTDCIYFQGNEKCQNKADN